MQELLENFSDKFIVCRSTLDTRYLKNWLCSLFDEEFSVSAVPERFRTGVFPLKMLQKLGVEVNFEKTFEPALNKQQCLQNLRYFFHVLGKKGVNIFDYKEKDLYLGRSQQVWTIVQLIFSEIYYKKCLINSKVLYSWLSDIMNSEVCCENLLQLFNSPSAYLKILNSKLKKKKSRAKFELSPKKILKNHEIPCYFEDYDIPNNTNFSFLYVQLWTIFTNLQENSLFCKSSTDSTSKDSIQDLNSSLEIFVKSSENPNKHQKLQSPERAKPLNSHSKLNETDLILCYLMTPRIVQMQLSGQLKRVLLNILEENSNTLNKLYMNITELDQLETLYFFPLDQIEHIDSSECSLTFIINDQKLKIVYKNQSECLSYLNGIVSLLSDF